MKVVVVFESMFGNTESLADEVRDGLLESDAEVAVIEVGAAGPGDFEACDLVVVAAPTHALTLSRPESRAEAVTKGGSPLRVDVGVREWLASIDHVMPARSSRPAVAVFDTRVFKARRWPGSAGKRMARILKQRGFKVVDQTSFFVDDIAGPLTVGERERAHAWGKALTD